MFTVITLEQSSRLFKDFNIPTSLASCKTTVPAPHRTSGIAVVSLFTIDNIFEMLPKVVEIKGEDGTTDIYCLHIYCKTDINGNMRWYGSYKSETYLENKHQSKIDIENKQEADELVDVFYQMLLWWLETDPDKARPIQTDYNDCRIYNPPFH